MIHRKFLPFAALASIALVATTAHGALLVYEGFDYDGFAVADYPTGSPNPIGTGNANSLHGNSGGAGLSGSWVDAASQNHSLWVAEGSLEFGDLLTSGNHVRYHNNLDNDRYHREITADLSVGDELWFSFLANRLQNNNSAGREGIAITNTTVSSAQFDNISATGLQGFGIAATAGTTTGTAYTAWGWDGTDAVSGTGSITVPVNGSQTNLFVGHIEYGVGTDGADVFSFYNYLLNDGSVIGGTLSLVTSIEVDVDESLLDTLNITRQVNTAYDEIRIGTTLDSVIVPIPEPATALLGSIGMLFLLRRRR